MCLIWLFLFLNESLMIIFFRKTALIARFMGLTWGPPGADRTQVGLMWATWTLLYETNIWHHDINTLYTILAISERNPLVTDGFPSWKNSYVENDVFFIVRLNKLRNKYLSCQWFEMPWHCNDITVWRQCTEKKLCIYCGVLDIGTPGVINTEHIPRSTTVQITSFQPYKPLF